MTGSPDWLASCAAAPLFQGIPLPRVQSLLEGRIELRHYRRGDVLDDYLRKLGIVAGGRLAVRSPGGTLLNQLTPGAMFGVSTVFTDYSAHITEISAEVTSTVILISEQQLIEIFAQDVNVNRNYVNFLTDRIRFLNWKIDLFSAATAEEKLRRYLLHLRKEDDRVTVDPLSWLGDTLGMGRASLYRVIEKLEREGCLRRETRNCWQVNWDLLEHRRHSANSQNNIRKEDF